MFRPTVRRCYALLATVAALAAAEHHGTVKTGNLPLPGATITASQGDKTMVTTSDDRGAYRFADLADGEWTIQVRMLGFEGVSKEVAIAPGAPAPEWQLKMLSESALVASLSPTSAKSADASGPRPAGPPQGGFGQGGPGRGGPMPGGPPQGGPAQSSAAQGRGPGNPQQRGQQQQGSQGFQRLAVNQSADSAQANGEGTIKAEEIADLSQNAANSFIVQGSMSSAAGLGQQNDWGPRGMDGGPMMGMGGPGMGGPGMGGPGGDGPPGGGGRGGPGGGGPGMMMMGGRGGGPGGGGPGGGGPGGGGPGGGGPGGGGPGGPDGGPGGGRGGPDWMRGPNALAFGNGRRDPRNMYQMGADFTLDNSVWDARSFSVTGAEVAKPSYAAGRGGVNFGGPLQIPKLVSPNKRILFSINYQFQRNHTGATSTPVNMPTALERTGDFSQTLLQGAPVVIYDPSTGLPFPNDRIPSSRISSTATALLKYFPPPNLPFATRNYETALNGLNHTQNLNSRVSNIKFGNNDRLSGGVGYQQSSSVTPNMFQFVDTGSGRGLNANLNWSHSFTRKLTNSLTYTFSRMTQKADPYFAGRENVAAELGILGTSQESANWGPPNLSFTNYGSLTDGNYSLNRNQTSSLGEGLTWTHGLHNFSFGGDYRRQQFNQLADNNGRGAYSFDGSATSAYVNGVAQTGTGYDLADFLLSVPTTSSIRYGNPDKYFRGSLLDWYINDDWRLRPRFSLILGLRYEYQSPESELYNRLVNLAVAPGWSAISAVTPAQIHPDRNNFAPRLGFAWRPLTKGSLVVRGGYGLYYNSSIYNVIASNMAQQPPFAQSLSATNSLTNPFSILTGFESASSTAGTSTFALDPNYRVGYAQTWNLTVQHDLPYSMFGTIGYLGTKGTRLDQQFIPNSVAPGAVASSLPHNYTYETSNGDSIYHAAQFQLNRRFHSGFMWRASYQFSKSIDNAGTGGRGQGNTPVAQNWLDLAAERGLSSFDNRHNLGLQLQYSSGMGTTGGTLIRGWRGAVLKDWTITNSFNLHSGNPLTATVGGNLSQVSGTAVSNTVRAEATGLAIAESGGTFNTAAFEQPIAGAWGDAGRNTIPGPTIFSMDSSLGRIFRFGERRSADLQFQTTNILNHVTITNWGTVVGSSTYGEATNAANMRKMTISLRFRF